MKGLIPVKNFDLVHFIKILVICNFNLWYSREYSQDYDTKRRIDTVYEYIKSIQSK